MLGGPQGCCGRYGDDKTLDPTGTRTPRVTIQTELPLLLAYAIKKISHATFVVGMEGLEPVWFVSLA
jgi:hypothetical protein